MSMSTMFNTTEKKSSFVFNPTMSLYIARVYANITPSFIINVFEDKIRFGKIRSVRIEKIPHSKNNYSAIIQFESWNETVVTTNFQTRIFKQGFARVVHDDPWFWIVMENNLEMVQSAKQDKDTPDEVLTSDEVLNQIDDSTFKSQELFELINCIVYNMKKIVNN